MNRQLLLVGGLGILGGFVGCVILGYVLDVTGKDKLPGPMPGTDPT